MFGKKPGFTKARAMMVKTQLIRRGINDPRIVEAMTRIPRHRFVEKRLWDVAYEDRPLPIGFNQTISQPYIVAFMTQALKLPQDKQGTVLEIGTGSGYQAAILSQLAAKVYTIERVEELATNARQILDTLDINNVEIRVGDGGYGWAEHAPYNGIIITAAAPEIPAPLITQLTEGGILEAPIGPRHQQVLRRLQRCGNDIHEETLAPVAFVPLLGEHGWAD